jgi:hypothetical protein
MTEVSGRRSGVSKSDAKKFMSSKLSALRRSVARAKLSRKYLGLTIVLLINSNVWVVLNRQ